MSGRLWKAAVGNKVDLTGMTKKDLCCCRVLGGTGEPNRGGEDREADLTQEGLGVTPEREGNLV